MKTDDILVEHLPNGGLLLSTMHEGERVKRLYMLHSEDAARREFRKLLKFITLQNKNKNP
jgi:hypothetical protein